MSRVAVTVRALRDDEIRRYLEIHERAIRGLAGSHYSQEAIEGWVVPATDENVRRLRLNADREIRLVAELDGRPVGIGALVLETAELRAVYVSPEGARQGCGSALVHEIERIARDGAVARLTLHASLNAEQFYASLGYGVLDRTEVVLPNNHRMEAVAMAKDL
ncbi:MAG: GNAT family N-acetyltransferase [Acidobacteria bacterium]|nr:GNAT family N-acetyltransferase [Acidobacteriota bacterium]